MDAKSLSRMLISSHGCGEHCFENALSGLGCGGSMLSAF